MRAADDVRDDPANPLGVKGQAAQGGMGGPLVFWPGTIVLSAQFDDRREAGTKEAWETDFPLPRNSRVNG